MAKRLIFDPPGGWRYGFPRPIPEKVHAAVNYEIALRKWLQECGYPETDIPLALKHSRYWEGDDGAA